MTALSPEGEEILARSLSLKLEGREEEARALLNTAALPAPEMRRRWDAARRLDERLRPALAPATPPPLEGFHSLLQLGEGSTGRIYLARREGTDGLVCLKTLHPGADRPALLERLRREGRVLSELDHPHIISLIDTVDDSRHGFSLVLPYVRGVPLNAAVTYLRRHPGATAGELLVFVAERVAAAEAPLPPECRSTLPPPGAHGDLVDFLAGVMERVAGALGAAHARGLVHRDVKPSNILLTPAGQPVLVDFGLTRDGLAGDMTLAGEFLGTPLYTAPECLWRGGAVADLRSDIYSLGATFYEMFTGRPPFDGESLRETLERIEAGGPTRPRRLRPGLPAGLETVLLRCLEKRPADRYASTEDLVRDLRSFSSSGRVVSRPLRAGRWGRPLLLGAAVWILWGGGVRVWEDWLEQAERNESLLLRRSVVPVSARVQAAAPVPFAAPAARRQPRPSPPEVPAAPPPSPARDAYADPEGAFSWTYPDGWILEPVNAPRSVGFRRPDAPWFMAARVHENPSRDSLQHLLDRLEKITPGKPRFFGNVGAGRIDGRPFLGRKFFASGRDGEEVHAVMLVDLGEETLLLDAWAPPEEFGACRRELEAALEGLRFH